jgi:RNA polymerase sigma-70 factor, ECF subfamily
MNQAKQTDEWLMAQVAAGQREHLAVLLRRYASPLLTYLERMAGDHHRGEELFQDVFLRVWIKRGTYRFPRPFRAWLFAIATNHCRSAYRRSGPRPVSLTEDAPDGLTAPGESPFEAAVATETASLVAAAVEQLPPQQREVVVLRNFSGLSFGEIAQAVGCSEPTARSHMHHALGGLRRFLERRVGG